MVARRELLAMGVVGLTLEPVDTPLPAWSPGAHVDLVLPSGLVRQYSLCGPLSADSYEIAVFLEHNGRGGSSEVHREVVVGTELALRDPRNRFPLEPALEYLFLAGGIGITPFLPMVEQAEARGASWRLIYGGRSKPEMAFLDRLSDFSGSVVIVPQDRCGLIDVASELAAHPRARVYVCGPPGMISAVQVGMEASEDGARLHFERFITEPGTSEAHHPGDSACEVQLGFDGPVIKVGADKSILDSIVRAGVDVLFSCEEGTCGSCQTKVLAGEIDHRDDLLTDEERKDGQMLICVSRSMSPRLVLDIPA